MRIVFMGSAQLSCASLEALLASHEHVVAAAITQPARPKGRSLRLSPCPVGEVALRNNLKILSPENVNTPESIDALRALAPDMVVVVAYGQILKEPILSVPVKGFINVHTSMLPKYRGAAPIQRAIANGDLMTGVTIMHVERRMDAGDIIQQRAVPIDPEDTAGTLHDRLAQEGATLLIEALAALAAGTAPRVRQNEAEVTYAAKLTKEEGRIDWTIQAVLLHNKIRGFNPWPACYCGLPGDKAGLLKVLRTAVVQGGAGMLPGTLVRTESKGPVVATGQGALLLLEVQPEGKRAMDGGAFMNGYRLKIGDRLS